MSSPPFLGDNSISAPGENLISTFGLLYLNKTTLCMCVHIVPIGKQNQWNLEPFVAGLNKYVDDSLFLVSLGINLVLGA